MLIGVAGVPVAHFNRFQQQSGRLAGSGHSVVGVNAPANGGVQQLGVGDAEKLVTRVTNLLGKEPAKGAAGFGVIYLAHPWVDTSAFEAHLHPAAVGVRVELPAPVVTAGRAGEVYINTLLGMIAEAVPQLIRAVGAVRSELEGRRNRTPLLLPLRNFSSRQLEISIARLAGELPRAASPHDLVREACAEIEAQHPYQPKGPLKGFIDEAQIVFKSPGRDLHGAVWANHNGTHNVSCKLNGLFRLGGPITRGFHFDCLRGVKLVGTFRNCHDASAAYEGKPHLNIAPNDFVRG